MEIAWKLTAERLVCRWSEAGEHVHYDSPWIQDALRAVNRENAPAPLLDLSTVSPFGREWYASDRVL